MRVLLIAEAGGAGYEQVLLRLRADCEAEGHAFERALPEQAESTGRADAVLFAADASGGQAIIELLAREINKKPQSDEKYPAMGLIVYGGAAAPQLVELFNEFAWHFRCDSMGVQRDEKGITVSLELITAGMFGDCF